LKLKKGEYFTVSKSNVVHTSYSGYFLQAGIVYQVEVPVDAMYGPNSLTITSPNSPGFYSLLVSWDVLKKVILTKNN